MTKIRFKAILFDLDGTLLDTLKDLADSMNAVLSRHGMNTFPVDDYRLFVGKGLRELMKCVLPEDKISEQTIDEFLLAMRSEYSKRWTENSKPYSGVPELLDGLQKIGLPMAVLSNKADEFTQIMVRTLLSKWQFQCIRGLKDDLPAKPDPASALWIAHELKIQPSNFIYLGDTGIDMQTANAAGMYAAGALWGFRTAEELRANGAKILVRSPLQVLELLNL
jgi:phosphoglycolate phosphatase